MNGKTLEAVVHNQPGMARIDLIGEISGPVAEVLNQAYENAMLNNPPTVVINFTQVDYINSTGIALILSLLVKAGRAHRRLIAFGLSDHYREIFRITRLADFIKIYADEESALAAV